MNQSNDYMDKINYINNEINYLSIKSKGLTHDEFIKDETLKRAFVRSLEIIGEAAGWMLWELTIQSSLKSICVY